MSGVCEDSQSYDTKAGDALDEFSVQFRSTLDRLTSLRTLSFILISLALTFMMYLLSFALTDFIASKGYLVHMSVSTILMELIPILITIAAAYVATEKEGLLELSGVHAIAGRYLGAVAVTSILMIPVYVMIIVVQTLHGAGNQISSLQSFALTVVFAAIVTAVAMLLNTRTKHAFLLTFLAVFIIVPLFIYIIGPATDLVDYDVLCSVIPVPDMIAAVNASGHGGMTTLSAMSLVKASSGLPLDAFASFILFFGWAILLFSVLIFVTDRRKSE